MRDARGRYLKGVHAAPATQFKKGQHWRPHKPHWDRAWLLREYVLLGRTSSEIAAEVGCKENNIHFWLKKHGIATRSISETRQIKHWGLSGEANGMFGKRGPLNPNWTGGQHERVNPQYSVWRKAVIERDCGRCSLCHTNKRLEVHHIVRFGKDAAKRWEVSNGLTLCHGCHVRFRGREDDYEEILAFIASVPRLYIGWPAA